MKYVSISSNERGFTAVEILITIVVAAVFATSFYMLFMTINTSSAQIRSQATASELAYSYLRKYVSAGATTSWFTCDTTAGSSINDLTKNSNAPGQIIDSGTLTPTAVDLPGPVSYTVKALAVYGCTGSNTSSPLRVEATVIYGPNDTKVKHATYMDKTL